MMPRSSLEADSSNVFPVELTNVWHERNVCVEENEEKVGCDLVAGLYVVP